MYSYFKQRDNALSDGLAVSVYRAVWVEMPHQIKNI